MRVIRESWSQAFLAETVEAGDKNRGVRRAACGVSYSKRHACFVKLFRNGSVREFYRLKALITLEQVNISVVEKKNLL